MNKKRFILIGSICTCLLVGIGGYRFITTGSFFAKEETVIDENFFLGKNY